MQPLFPWSTQHLIPWPGQTTGDSAMSETNQLSAAPNRGDEVVLTAQHDEDLIRRTSNALSQFQFHPIPPRSGHIKRPHTTSRPRIEDNRAFHVCGTAPFQCFFPILRILGEAPEDSNSNAIANTPIPYRSLDPRMG